MFGRSRTITHVYIYDISKVLVYLLLISYWMSECCASYNYSIEWAAINSANTNMGFYYNLLRRGLLLGATCSAQTNQLLNYNPAQGIHVLGFWIDYVISQSYITRVKDMLKDLKNLCFSFFNKKKEKKKKNLC